MSSWFTLKRQPVVAPWRRWFVAALLVGWSAGARAEPACGEGTRAKVAVRFEGQGWRSPWATAVPLELATEIDVARLCETPSEADAAAQIVLRLESATVVDMEVSAGEGTARRSVRRRLELEALPKGQWAFAVGVSASELLREAREVLPVLRAEPASRPPAWASTLRGSALFSTGGLAFFGVELGARRSFGPILLELDALVSWAPPRTVELGTVSVFAAGARLSGGLLVVAVQGFFLELGVAGDARWLSARGAASSPLAEGETSSTLAVVALAVSTVGWSRGPFEASVRLGLGGVVRGVSLQASGEETSAFKGLAGLAAAGVGVRF